MGKRIFRHSAHPPESLCFFVDLIASIEILKSKTEYLMRRIAEDSRKLNALSVFYHKLSREERKICTWFSALVFSYIAHPGRGYNLTVRGGL